MGIVSSVSKIQIKAKSKAKQKVGAMTLGTLVITLNGYSKKYNIDCQGEGFDKLVEAIALINKENERRVKANEALSNHQSKQRLLTRSPGNKGARSS